MTRAIDSAGLFQSYLALGLEPGTAWETVQKRYKDLIMAWHPDRFLDDKQKLTAEEELKKINAARDKLHRHFRREHSKHGPCICQSAATSSTGDKQTAAAKPAPRAGLDPRQLLNSRTKTAAALCILCLVTLVAFPRILGTMSSYKNAPPADSFSSSQAPSGTTTATPLPGAARTPAAEKAKEADLPSDQPEQTGSTSSGSTEPKARPVRAIPGTFFAGLVKHQQERKSVEVASKRAALDGTLTEAKRMVAQTKARIAQMEKQIAAIDLELDEHQSVLGEIQRVETELEAPTGPAAGPASMQLYLSNPSYKQHADALTILSQRRQALEAASLQEKQNLAQAKTLYDNAKAAIDQLKLVAE